MNSTTKYEPLTKEALGTALKKLSEDKKGKEWILYMDLDTAMQIDKELHQEVTRGQLKHLENSGFIDKEEAKTLKLMMNASDADFTVAQLIIDNYESNI
jgi:hypothetical protein